MGVSVIETAGIVSTKVDSLLIKSMAAAVSQSVLSVPVSLTQGGAAEAWDAVKSARRPRLRVSVPVSAVQMEYLLRKKPAEILGVIQTVVAEAKRYCQDVEFAAQDATRAEPDFLRSAIEAAVDAGCTCVTVCDSAGTMLPDEFSAFVKTILQMVPSGVRVGAACSNTLNIACACSFAAMQAGMHGRSKYPPPAGICPLWRRWPRSSAPGATIWIWHVPFATQSFSAPFSRSSGSSSLSGARPALLPTPCPTQIGRI